VRERDDIRRELAAQKLGVRESHPDVLIRRWNARFGPERTAELCRFDNTRPDVVIRPNRLQITLEDLRGRLESAGIRATPHPAAPEQCLKLGHGTRVENLPGYAEGMFTVQDPSTLRSVDRLDPQPGESILDACAAPGGKTLLIAERLRGQGQIVAMDLHRDRLLPLADNLRRLRIDNARIVLGDASDPAAVGRAGGAPFDRILLDVPCSNTGVLRRRPDARWRFSPGRLGKLVRMQRSLLDSVSGFLKPGGCLVYSTCSLEHEENEGMVRAWVEEHPHFALGGCEVTFPPETRTDGVYAASLRRGPAR
jgi:16S rRNA (cytosine967-C5)-methyltransferase